MDSVSGVTASGCFPDDTVEYSYSTYSRPIDRSSDVGDHFFRKSSTSRRDEAILPMVFRITRTVSIIGQALNIDLLHESLSQGRQKLVFSACHAYDRDCNFDGCAAFPYILSVTISTRVCIHQSVTLGHSREQTQRTAFTRPCSARRNGRLMCLALETDTCLSRTTLAVTA